MPGENSTRAVRNRGAAADALRIAGYFRSGANNIAGRRALSGA